MQDVEGYRMQNSADVLAPAIMQRPILALATVSSFFYSVCSDVCCH